MACVASGGIPYRAARRSSIDVKVTPAVVGPGTYDPRASASAPARPGFTGFASSAHRNLNHNSGTSSMTPGPGAYGGHAPEAAPQVAKSNVFRSGIARMAPSAPGSTVYTSSSVVDNPGPDTTCGRIVRRPRSQKKAPKQKSFMVIAQRSKPAIPRREQSHGYKETEGRKLVQQQPAEPVFTGVGRDCIGPGQYDPAIDLITGATKSTNFHASRQQRKLFEPDKTRENWLPDRANPGPAQYNPAASEMLAASVLGGTRGTGGPEASGAGKSSMFASRVKMTHQLSSSTPQPGPGNYRVSSELEASVAGINPNVLQGFGSLAKRAGWNRSADQPFTTPSNVSNPGPGTYGEQRNSFARSKAKRPTLIPEAEIVGFNASDDRPCCVVGSANTSRLGPGSHNVERVGSIADGVAKKLVSTTAAFGSSATQPRFKFSPKKRGGGGGGGADAGATGLSQPGPGDYENRDTMAEPYGSVSRFRPEGQASGAFKSGSVRISRPAGGGHDRKVGNIYIVGEKSGFYKAPPPNAYLLKSDFDKVVDKAKHEGVGCRDAGSAFLGSGCRFDPGQWVKNQDNPGPAQYSGAAVQSHRLGPRRRNAPPGRFSMATRFQPARTVGNVQSVPPDAYEVAGSMVRRSFNITMA